MSMPKSVWTNIIKFQENYLMDSKWPVASSTRYLNKKYQFVYRKCYGLLFSTHFIMVH